MASLGEVYQAAVPKGLKLESETEVILKMLPLEVENLTANEQSMLHLLSDGKKRSISEAERVFPKNNVKSLVKQLLDKGYIEVHEALQSKVKPKTECYINLPEAICSEGKLHEVFNSLKRAPLQLSMLATYIEMSEYFVREVPHEVAKKELLAKSGGGTQVLASLVTKGFLSLYTKELSRLQLPTYALQSSMELNPAQQKAWQQIQHHFQNNKMVLLHGVTSSGKTEIYIHLMEQMRAQKKQVLYLVPEIALTTQLTNRLSRVFGDSLCVYHSKLSDAERVEIWNTMLRNDSFGIVLGVRSSIFLPFHELGLVIIDEEHDPSYKQQEAAPRYHARNAAIILAQMHHAKVIMGSATPSVESYFHALQEKYALVELLVRHHSLELPFIQIVNMKEAYRKKQFTGHFSDDLLVAIQQTLERKEQTILFQNRRGYAPVLECKACAYVPKCTQCDVSLTVHLYTQALCCHYCGYTEKTPSQCPACKSIALQHKGFGTEKVEEEIQQLFPQAKVVRMDMDTTRTRTSYQQIVSDMEAGNIDILIGTQMITKGLDFANVQLIGILNADNLLHFPDFRAHERAFQLMAQVSGRAGRNKKRGWVVLQTYDPEHPVVQQVLQHDYPSMFRIQCDERKSFFYPPFSRMVQLTLKHKDVTLLKEAAAQLVASFKKRLNAVVLGPVVPVVSRIHNVHIRQVIVKTPVSQSHVQTREIMENAIKGMLAQQPFKAIQIQIDVDPY